MFRSACNVRLFSQRLIASMILLLGLGSVSIVSAALSIDTTQAPISGNESVPSLPNISHYTGQWVRDQQAAVAAELAGVEQRVAVEDIYNVPPLRIFTEGRRAVEWLRRQAGIPKAIVLQAGLFSINDIVSIVNNNKIARRLDDETVLIRLPILVDRSAALLLKPGERLLLSKDKGAFVINEGVFFAIEAQIVGWDERVGAPAAFESDKKFRPFFSGFGVSKSYFYASVLKNLGYFSTKSYGFTVSSNPIKSKNQADQRPDDPKAWLIENDFEQLYYGFYSYEAHGTIIVRNRYFDSIVYGIDPHDYSSGLVIAYNKAAHTRKKHGIIISREVDNSWIFGNVSTDNNGSGFVLDRQCSGNVVAFNTALRNVGDGISFFESPDNVVYGNVFSHNGKHGIRVRNSYDIKTIKNVVTNNGQQGIYLATADFTAQERNLKYDPYVKRADLQSISDQVVNNRSGIIGSDGLYPLDISGMKVQGTASGSRHTFVGAMAPYANRMLVELLRHQRRVIFRLERGQ